MAKKSGKPIILCDTNIFIEILQQNVVIKQRFDAIGVSNVAINSVIKAELYRGAKDKEDFLVLKNVLQTLHNFKIDLPTSKKFEELMTTYALSHRPAVADMLIASTAIVNSLPLFTLNTADFDFIEDLKLYVG